jgi:ferredoxin-NADP reductase
MESGSVIAASGPYGFFYSEETDSTLVLLAGGIGIAPFRSIISDTLHRNPERKIFLHYSVSDYPDAAFLEDFSSFKKSCPGFAYTVHVTKGAVAGGDCCPGRISADKVAFLHKDDPSAEYFMCGSIPFVRDMWRGLRAYNIPEERLYTEAFFA